MVISIQKHLCIIKTEKWLTWCNLWKSSTSSNIGSLRPPFACCSLLLRSALIFFSDSGVVKYCVHPFLRYWNTQVQIILIVFTINTMVLFGESRTLHLETIKLEIVRLVKRSVTKTSLSYHSLSFKIWLV